VAAVTTVVKTAFFLKRYWKQILSILFGLILLFLMLPIMILAQFMPGAEEEELKNYIVTANHLGISWQDLIAFDMVLNKNDLRGVDPNDSAKYFISLRYEEFTPASSYCAKEEEGTCTEVVNVPEKVNKVIEADTYKSVTKFFKKHGTGSTLKEKIDSINMLENTRIIITSKVAEEAMDDAGFTKKQKEEFFDILESGVLQEMFSEYESIGMIPGACVNNVSPDGKAKANAKVQSYTETIKKYADKYGITPYVELAKAVMMAESGGSGGDPMQASESVFANSVAACQGKSGAARIGCITDPEDSINAGVQELKKALELANYDIAIALQTYNFGPYFATWIKENGGTYTVEIAQQYSNTIMAAAGQGLGTPTHAQKILTQFYQHEGCVAGDITPEMVGANDWVWPTKSTRITSKFGNRDVPCAGCTAEHLAVDIGAVKPGIVGDPVWSMSEGTVSKAYFHELMGNAVFVDHGNGIISRYIHLNSYSVKAGQKVTKGQVIGAMGTTGSSTAAHLDFQIKVNGTPVDPLKFFPNI